MKTRNVRTLILVGGLTGLAACSRPDSDVKATPESFADLLKYGKTVSYHDADANVAFTKTAAGRWDGAIARRETEPETGLVAYVSFRDSDAAPQAKAAADLPELALDVIADLHEHFALDTRDLKRAAQYQEDVAEGLKRLQFTRSLGDVPVVDATVSVFFRKAGDAWRVSEIVNHAYGEITLANPTAAAEAPAALLQRIGMASATVTARRDVVFPKAAGTKDIRFHAAQEISFRDADGIDYVATFANGGGEILQAFSRQLTLRRLNVQAYARSYLYADKTIAYPLARVRVDGRATDEQGQGEVSGGQAQVTLASALANVQDLTQGFGAQATVNASVEETPDGEALLRTDKVSPAVNAYVAVGRVTELAGRYLSSQDTKGYLGQAVTIRVNSRQGDCNAYYTGRSLTFYAASQRCANTALINDVVYHEWGHGLNEYTATYGIHDQAFSEGVGDIVASYLTGDSNMSPGFFQGREQGIRQLKNDKRHSPGLREEVHEQGRIIGGAFWDMREAFIERYGRERGPAMAERIFFKHLTATDTYVDSYRSALRVDEPGTGGRSKNYCLITEAFARHGLAQPQADCQDKVDGSGDLHDDDGLHLALQEAPGGKTHLWFAGATGTPRLCRGALRVCQGNGERDIAFQAAGSAGNRLYRSVTPLDLKDGEIVTLFSIKSGKLDGYRQFRLKGVP